MPSVIASPNFADFARVLAARRDQLQVAHHAAEQRALDVLLHARAEGRPDLTDAEQTEFGKHTKTMRNLGGEIVLLDERIEDIQNEIHRDLEEIRWCQMPAKTRQRLLAEIRAGNH